MQRRLHAIRQAQHAKRMFTLPAEDIALHKIGEVLGELVEKTKPKAVAGNMRQAEQLRTKALELTKLASAQMRKIDGSDARARQEQESWSARVF